MSDTFDKWVLLTESVKARGEYYDSLLHLHATLKVAAQFGFDNPQSIRDIHKALARCEQTERAWDEAARKL